MDKAPGAVLALAYDLYEKGEYEKALENYEWFYDNAEKIDSTWSGAKYRSLKEWSDLGQKYKPAYDLLNSKRIEAFSALEEERTQSTFRDYARICHVLHLDQDVINSFIYFQTVDPNFAQAVYIYIEDILINNKQWEICSKYIVDGMGRYIEKLAIFDELMKISKMAYDGEFDQNYIKKFTFDINNLIDILRSEHRDQEIEAIRKKVILDMEHRGYEPIKLN